MASESTTTMAGALPGKLVNFFLWGVLLPIITIAVELVYRLSAEILFDPFPSFWHLGLVACVPIANCALLTALTTSHSRSSSVILQFSSIAIAINAFYSILYLPILPLSVLSLVYFGFGLLPLTPLICLIASLRLRARLVIHERQIGGQTKFWPGFLFGLCLMVAIDLPTTVTRLGLQLSASSSSALQGQALRWLRLLGNEKVLLQHCYAQSHISTDLIGALFVWSDPIDPEIAQSVYYRVTGKAYNSGTKPEIAKFRNGGWRARARAFDFDQGGVAVGAKLEDLSLATSQLDGSFDAQAALAYLEWTMVFKNDSSTPREARAQIALPPQAVISRLTLWIDGEEREAAFAGTSAVRSAYEKVVRQQRDPVLVTSAGQDRALVQLFPVPAQGEMKIRIGMTVPARVNNGGIPVMQLPYFHEQNFSISASLRHAVRVGSNTAMQSGAESSSPVSGGHSLRSQLENAVLASGAVRISSTVKAQPIASVVDSKDPGQAVIQRLAVEAVKAPEQVLMVVDGSFAMRSAAQRLADMAKLLPPDRLVTLIFAQDAGTSVDLKTERVLPAVLAQRLLAFDYFGGHDNLPALLHAQALAVQQPDSAVIWLHGPQPVNFGSVEPWLKAAQSQIDSPSWYMHQIAPGGNRLIESARSAFPSQILNAHDLAELFLNWRAGSGAYTRQFERVAANDAGNAPATHPTSDHLVRLWAFDQVHQLTRRTGQHNQAVALARRYQLVTPVSGAVVLETQQQYDEAGLSPVKHGTVPTIPEPETWALLGVALSVLAYRARRNKQRAAHVPA